MVLDVVGGFGLATIGLNRFEWILLSSIVVVVVVVVLVRLLSDERVSFK